MFRLSSEEEYEQSAEGGVRQLFSLGPFVFQDTLDPAGQLHHFVFESTDSDEEVRPYEVDQQSMYELMARYLAGEYEKEEYDLERSPGHDALLDLLELASARARSGESDFSIDELEGVEEESEDGEDDEDEEFLGGGGSNA